jgi:hypothetical protein
VAYLFLEAIHVRAGHAPVHTHKEKALHESNRVTIRTGYPFNSGFPNRLWLGLFPFDGRVHNLPVSCWFDCDGLLHQPVEEFASAARFAAVESECEFVSIILKMFFSDRSLLRPQQPALQQRKDMMDAWQEFDSPL